MFSFFKKKPPPAPPAPADAPTVASGAPSTAATEPLAAPPAPAEPGALKSLWQVLNTPIPMPFSSTPSPAPSDEPPAAPEPSPAPTPSAPLPTAPAPVTTPVDAAPPVTAPTAPLVTAPTARPGTPPVAVPSPPAAVPAPPATVPQPEPAPLPVEPRANWMGRLKAGLRKTGSSITQVFTGTRIDEALYEELESALLMADAGMSATQHLLDDLKRRVKTAKATDPAAVRALLVDALADLLKPLEKGLVVGEHVPTVIMVAGVNGAGKTTSIGKLTRHLAEADCKVLLAAADTFRAAAREQLAAWADRNKVEIVAQEGGDPAAVTFDAVVAGKARGCDVVIADTAGRLPTQTHLMDELKKIQRTIGKAQAGAPHEVLLVVDGNTGQNALAQVKAFDAALGLTGLVVTKLDGTAKGGVLAAIARWGAERSGGPVPVYFIGIGEKLQDLQTFDAREFAQALVE
jgi:fused signal recognition particle receptor